MATTSDLEFQMYSLIAAEHGLGRLEDELEIDLGQCLVSLKRAINHLNEAIEGKVKNA